MREQTARDRAVWSFEKFLIKNGLRKNWRKADNNVYRKAMFELYVEGYKAALADVYGKSFEDIPDDGDDTNEEVEIADVE